MSEIRKDWRALISSLHSGKHRSCNIAPLMLNRNDIERAWRGEVKNAEWEAMQWPSAQLKFLQQVSKAQGADSGIFG